MIDPGILVDQILKKDCKICRGVLNCRREVAQEQARASANWSGDLEVNDPTGGTPKTSPRSGELEDDVYIYI